MTAVPFRQPGDQPAARIIDRGYRRYNGPRTGVRGAMVTVWRQSVQRALGLRRPTWAKVLPFLAIAMCYVPAIVFIGIVALVPEEELTGLTLPTYGEYFSFIAAAIVLLVSYVAPQLFCPDRRTGMIGIYLASPLNRDSYIVAKAAAVTTVVSMVTIGPPFLMLVANILQGVGPDGPAGVVATLARIVVAGFVLALIYTAVSVGISALTDRWVFATIAVLLVVLVSQMFLVSVIEVAELPDAFHAINLITGPFSLVQLIHGEPVEFDGLSLGVAICGAAAWIIVGAVVCRTRYQLLQVTR